MFSGQMIKRLPEIAEDEVSDQPVPERMADGRHATGLADGGRRQS